MGGYHVLAAGESLESVAYARGLYWPSVWELPENEDLRKLRVDPHVLAPGDRIFLPDHAPKSVPAASGRTHVFRRRAIPTRLRIHLFRGAEVGAKMPYAIDIDGKITQGETGEDGLIEEWIFPDARKVRVRVGLGIEQRLFDVDPRELYPVDLDDGVRARLDNLGFRSPDVREALRRFQEANGLEGTGELTDATRAKLKELYTQ